MNIRIRGIYATALTYILSQMNFNIVQQSLQIVERFKMSYKPVPADITIKDGNEKGNIIVIGHDMTFDIYPIIRNIFKYSIVWKSPVKLYSVITTEDCKYKGFKVEPCFETGLVTKPPLDGKIFISEPKAVGRFAMVWRSSKGSGSVFFSEHISPEQRARLKSISTPLTNKGYNVKWRSNAPYASNNELKNELERLAINFDSFNFSSQGEDFIYVIPSLEDKRKLDEIRGKIVPTVNFHHMLKLSYTSQVDEAENSNKDVTTLLRNLINEFMNIEHVKPEGKIMRLTGGKVEYQEVTNDYFMIRLKRNFSAGGVYDGLGIPKEEGDYDIVEFDSRKWYQVHKYYNSRGELKGVYVNISTPPELLSGRIRYIDLEVDVVKVNDEIKIVDLEALEEKKELLGTELYDKALSTVDEIKRILKEGAPAGI